ncbi:MAG: DUF58 domain-containing protein [SAR202 cluster bacterium]|nr:DUF58 domain-containing protein [SAR202 cluster bacterium]
MLSQLWQELWVGLFAVLIVIGLFAGQGILIAFGVMGLVVSGVSWVWSRIALQDVSYERRLGSKRAFIGEEVAFSVALTNRKPIPLPMVEDEIPEAVEVVGEELAVSPSSHTRSLRHRTAMAWYERVTWEYRLRCTRRGYFKIGPAALDSGDIFGFFDSRLQSDKADYLLVFPRIVPLPKSVIPGARPVGDVRTGSPVFQDASRPAGVRDYQRGDPLKAIDWKHSARRQRLQTRVYEPSSNVTVMLAVAVDTTSHHWEGYSAALLERVVTVAASAATQAMERRVSLGMFSNGASAASEKVLRIPPSRDPDQLHIILESLATLRPIVLGPITRHLTEASRGLPLGATLVLVAAYVSPDLEDALRQVKQRGHPVSLVYVGEGECPQVGSDIKVHDLGGYVAALEAEWPEVQAAKRRAKREAA